MTRRRDFELEFGSTSSASSVPGIVRHLRVVILSYRPVTREWRGVPLHSLVFLGSLGGVVGGGRNLHLKDSRASERQHPAQKSCEDRRGPGIVPAVLTRKGTPRFPDFRPIGGPLNQGPVSRPWPNRETGSGNGDSLLVSRHRGNVDWGLPGLLPGLCASVWSAWAALQLDHGYAHDCGLK
jgi:hypothetical protein